MRQYRFTDKLLITLAIGNVPMFIFFIWGQMFPIKLFFIAKHNGYTIPLAMNTFLPIVEFALVLGVATWAFLKRIRWVIIPYVLYLSQWFPLSFIEFIQFWKSTFFGVTPNIEGINMIGNILPSQVYVSFYILVWLLALITMIVMVIETGYKTRLFRVISVFSCISIVSALIIYMTIKDQSLIDSLLKKQPLHTPAANSDLDFMQTTKDPQCMSKSEKTGLYEFTPCKF